MALEVLKNKNQIKQSRRKLLDRGVSLIESPMQSLMRSLKLRPGMAIGDRVKSWDVFLSLDFLESHLQKNEPILDIGCFASELVVALCKLGFSNLTGVDLNPHLHKMPQQDSVRYVTTDFMHTKFNVSSFKAITSISVIEHGFNSDLLLKEVSRLLKSGGYFIASFDYWRDKIDTSGLQYFGLDWKIFSEDEVKKFVTEAAGYGLFPLGEMKYGIEDKPISCGGKQYTFAWLVLVRRA